MALGGMRKRLAVLGKIPEFAANDYRNTTGKEGVKKAISELSRKQRRALKKNTDRLVEDYKRVLNEISNSGAGFPIDKLLHELCVEYTHRYASSGIYNQPMNFNYFEAFCEIKLHKDSVAPYAQPATEVDHLFSLIDFFEYVTGDESKGFSLTQLMELPEDRALHFTVNGDINDFTMMTPAKKEFVISGFSMIRRGNYLSWYIIGGEIFSPEDWDGETAVDDEFEPEHVPAWKVRFLTEAIASTGNKAGPPVPLEGTETAQRTIIAGEMDLISQVHLGRCYLSERANTFNIICDDPEIFDHVPDGPGKDSLHASFTDQVQRTEVMWRLSEAMFQLPAYFAFKIKIAKSVVVSAGKRASVQSKKGGHGIGLNIKTVSTIDFVSDEAVPVRSYTPNHYDVEIGGYWRRLSPKSSGIGRHGESVTGRTWVKKEKNVPEIIDAPRPIYVKSTIASAKLTAEQYISAASKAEAKSGNNAQNVLYVLRCMVMQDEIYKVGWTSGTAEERAKQISSATGVPNSFIVVGEWQHPQPDALEKNVHAMLDPYRIADNREFFKLKFDSLKRIIEQEISRVEKLV